MSLFFYKFVFIDFINQQQYDYEQQVRRNPD